jgi:hypothetical protein
MKKSTVIVSLFVLLVALTLMMSTGCSSKTKSYSQVPMSSQMQPSEFNPQVMTYRNPDVDIRQYKKVMLMPVDIYTGPDASFKGVSGAEQQELASYLYSVTLNGLQQKGLLTTQPGPGVATLKLILAGAEKTRPVASTVTHALPVGLALNLGKGAMGKEGSFMGTATVGGDFTDSTNGALVASFLTKQAPNAMDLPVMFSEWDASKKALEKVAQEITTRLTQIQLSQR